MILHAVGNVEDHVHVVVSIPPNHAVAEAVKHFKGTSSRAVGEVRPHEFKWQEGYGAFSIGISGVEDTTKYIERQAEHHRKTTFKEEIEAFLKKHGMEYVERDLE